MKIRLVAVSALLVAAFGTVTMFTRAQGPDVTADYDRATNLPNLVRNKVYDQVEPVTAENWIGTTKFWYRKTVAGGNSFMLVDAVAGTKAPAFDHARLATALSRAVPGDYTATTLPFAFFTFKDNQSAIDFELTAGGRGGAGRAAAAPGRGGAAPTAPTYHCTLTDYQCARLPRPAADTAPQGRGGGRGAAGRGGAAAGAAGGATAEPQVRVSPDGTTEAFIENYNVFVRPVVTGARQAPAATELSYDGSEGNYYTLTSVQWSPDSKKIAAYRHRPGYQRMVNYVQSSPSDQLQPKSSSRYYQKAGDVVDLDQPVLFDVVARKQTTVDNALFPNPYNLSNATASCGQAVGAGGAGGGGFGGRGPSWRRDSRAFTFEYNQRGHQVYRVIEVDATTGKARAVIDESSATFIDYRLAAPGLSDSGRQCRHDIADGHEVIWMSERDGWSHLYLYDGLTGQVKNQITKGAWAVHAVDRIDDANRQIYFWANGMDAGKDPYFLNYFRINFDGTGLTRYTTGEGQHTISWSPDRQLYVDTYSRVDLPPVSELRKASDQSLVMTLERASAADLLATGWKMPEVFVAKGRDGTTDIWGVIIRPTNFDPTKKYPVIENIYAGPQGSFVPKTFSTQTGMQSLAELGFIVVQMDGMGTGNRSKAFHDVAWKNLGDAGFPDRILWHKAVAAKYPWYDITRVGVYGTSAGGQNAMGAVVFHPEFYRAAAASAGCHDNRMDKIWWNEQWMGWPVGPQYAASSNMENAAKLGAPLFLLVGEMDTNVDPSSTMQVVNKLIQANKDFDLLVIPGADHTNGGAYGDHKRYDFFVRHLRGLEPPAWKAMTTPAASAGESVLDADAAAWVAAEDWGLDTGTGR